MLMILLLLIFLFSYKEGKDKKSKKDMTIGHIFFLYNQKFLQKMVFKLYIIIFRIVLRNIYDFDEL